MKNTDWADYWWSKITGPHEVVNAITRALQSKKSVVVVIPHDLPWRHELRRTVRNSLESTTGLEELLVDTIDIEDEEANDKEPGRLLLDKFALREDRANYREGGKESIQEYLLRKRVVHNRLVWIKGLASSDPKRWIQFCEKWSIENISDGLIVVETSIEPQAAQNKGLEIVQYNSIVGEYDAQLFNSLVLNDEETSGLTTVWKRYAAAITSHLCGTDAEVAERFILAHDFKKDDPLKTIAELANENDFARRGSGDHVFSLFRQGEIALLQKRIWAGQIEVLFPVIEKQRLEIIDEYREQLEREIAVGIEQFKSRVKKPGDIELGTLVYLCASKRITVRDRATRDKIHLLRDCRNLLAHRDTCSAEDTSSLFGV